MLCGLTHFIVPVADLDAALEIYSEGLGFAVVAQTPERVDLDASPLVFCLIRGSSPVNGLALRVQTLAVDEVARRLIGAGCTLQQGPIDCLARRERFAELADADGHRIELWRRLREDELPAPPPLPISRPWLAAAETLAQSLLAGVPEPLRDVARRGTVAEAELLCPEDDDVSEETYVRAFIRATPRLLRDELREPLRLHGFDPSAYEADFSC